MGARASSDAQLVSALLDHYPGTDNVFWTASLSRLPRRDPAAIPDPRFCNHLAAKNPQHFVNLGLLCAQGVKAIADHTGGRVSQVPALAHLASSLCRVLLQVVVYPSELCPVMLSLDEELGVIRL
jgi:hypothetical protein